MASSKLMASSASRESDLNRKVSACASTTNFLSIDNAPASDTSPSDSATGEGYLRKPYAEGNPNPESNSGARTNVEITLLDAVGAVAPISDGERQEPPPRAARKTVDDVWREIVAGKKSEQKPKEEMMTLEDFLAKASAEEEEEEEEEGPSAAVATARSGVVEVKEEGFSGGFSAYKSNSGVVGSGGSLGLDVGGRGKRSLSLLEPLDKAALQRQRRMIKNRESAARSRERKQAYQVELETLAVRLEEENDRLLREKAERRKKRLKQLMDNVIPIVEQRRPPRLHLRRVHSMQW